jgi:microcystin-dependent protein
MSDPFVAEIRIFPFNFAPRGWAMCNGQLLPISQNTALFSLVGTFYGGNGQSTFALPNLQGSAANQQGQGAGLSQYFVGQQTGSEQVTLLQTEIPSHSHSFVATTNVGTTDSASNNLLGVGASGSKAASSVANIYSTNAPNTPLSPLGVSVAGGSLAHNNMMPYLTLNFCIAMQGIFPPRG